MSGGAMNYVYSRLEEEAYHIPDREIRELTMDLAYLLKSLEWYLSCDTSEGSWLKDAEDFRNKWLRGEFKERLIKYIDEMVDQNRKELMNMIGMAVHCEDCKHFKRDAESNYGNCDLENHKHYMEHYYTPACDEFDGGEDEC